MRAGRMVDAMKPRVTLREALSDPSLLGNTMAGPSRLPWRVMLIAAMGEELRTDERILFKQLTGGREREPLQRVEEFEAVSPSRLGVRPCLVRHSRA
jgi:hypothetical protein